MFYQKGCQEKSSASTGVEVLFLETQPTFHRLRNQFFHLAMRRGRKIAKVAMARRLAVRLYWMWRRGWNYEQLEQFGSHAGQPEYRHGVQ